MFITLNLILCLGLTIFSIHPKVQEKNPRVGLLQSAVVSAYSTYLIWSSLSSEPSTKRCSKFPQPDDGGVSLLLGVLFTFLALIYSAMRVSSGHDTLQGKEPKEAKKRLLAPEQKNGDGDGDGDGDNTAPDEEEAVTEESETSEDDTVAYNYSFFHVTFVLAAMYLGMVLTNWQSVSSVTGDDVGNTILVDQGMAAVWVKVVSSWVTMLLYLWTMIAPILFPNRQFWDSL